MAVLTLPARTDLRAYSFQVELEGALYLFALRWNARAASWFMDITDTSGAPVIAGRRVVIDWPLLRTVVKENRPPGEILAVDTTNAGTDPGLDELGARVQLVYVESEG
jgi:hypothetical protein